MKLAANESTNVKPDKFADVFSRPALAVVSRAALAVVSRAALAVVSRAALAATVFAAVPSMLRAEPAVSYRRK